MRLTDMHGTGAQTSDATRPTIQVAYQDGVTVLDLVGEHDLTTAEEIAFDVAEQIARQRGVVVSLAETTFLDSSVIRELFRADREMLGQGRRLVLDIGGNQAARRVLEVAGADEHLLCCDTLEEAIAFASQHCDA